MAILKPFETNFKIPVTYHKLVKVEINSAAQTVDMFVAMYYSEQAKNEGGNPLWHEWVRVPFNELNFDPRDIFYPLLETWEHSYLKEGTSSLQPGVIPHPPVLEVVPTANPSSPPLP